MSRKKIVILILVMIITVFAACFSKKVINYAAFDLEKSELERVSNKVVLTSKINEEKDPINNLSSFEVRRGSQIIVYVSWFDLPIKELCFKVNLLGPDNTIIDQDFMIFKPHQPVYYTWLEFNLQENITPLGDIKIQVFLNNHLTKETSVKFVKFMNGF